MELAIFLYGILGISVISLIFYIKELFDKKRMNYINNYTNYITILNYHMEKAYDIIHKDNFLVYSLEGTKPSEEDINKHSKEFAVLVMNMIGPMMEKEFIFLYGDESSFYFNLLEFFNNKYEDDEIRKTALNNIGN